MPVIGWYFTSIPARVSCIPIEWRRTRAIEEKSAPTLRVEFIDGKNPHHAHEVSMTLGRTAKNFIRRIGGTAAQKKATYDVSTWMYLSDSWQSDKSHKCASNARQRTQPDPKKKYKDHMYARCRKTNFHNLSIFAFPLRPVGMCRPTLPLLFRRKPSANQRKVKSAKPAERF